MTANMLVTLPWTPQRANMIKINSTESIKGTSFTVTINGVSYNENFVVNSPFWRNSSGAGLNIYQISDANEIVVDKVGDCPAIESIRLNIEGVNVPIILKS